MTGTLAAPRPSGAHPQQRPDPNPLTRGCDAAIDLTVVVLATWTIVYHVCLLLRLGVVWAVCLEVAALAVIAAGSWRRRMSATAVDPSDAGMEQGDSAVVIEPQPSSATPRLLVIATIGLGTAAAVLVATNASWPLVATAWLLATVTGTGYAVLRLSAPSTFAPTDTTRPGSTRSDRWEPWIALTWAVGLAVLSLFTLWPNPDDLYYVNLSQWVVDHGTFPLRDTIFSNLVFPMSSWPPVASYDALAGTVGRLSGVKAATIVYVAVPPVATFLSVLALWRLLRSWRVRQIAVALSLALVFLLFDGGPGYAAPGNLFLTRIWQGKVILLCLLVPVLLVYALRYVERPTNRNAAWLFTGGVAAVGLSTTAMFLVPLIALAGAAPLALRGRVRLGLKGFAAMAAYPLATGIYTKAVGGRSADLFDSRYLFRFEPEWFGHEILRDGLLAIIAVAAVLGGALLIPHRAARVTTGILAAITGVTFVPGVTELSYDLVGLGPTLWRVSWVATIAALVGVLGAQLADRTDRPRVRAAIPVGLAAVLIVVGVPIWSESNSVHLKAPPHWQRGPSSVETAERVLDVASTGDVILAPQELAITIDVSTTFVKTVAPRDYFMDYLRDDPEFHFPERLTLVNFSNYGIDKSVLPDVARSLDVLDIDMVCLPVAARQRLRFIRTQGYQVTIETSSDSCLER